MTHFTLAISRSNRERVDSTNKFIITRELSSGHASLASPVKSGLLVGGGRSGVSRVASGEDTGRTFSGVAELEAVGELGRFLEVVRGTSDGRPAEDDNSSTGGGDSSTGLLAASVSSGTFCPMTF